MGPLFKLLESNSRNGVKLGKHAYGSYLLNENPAAEGGGKSQRRESLTTTSNRCAKHNDYESYIQRRRPAQLLNPFKHGSWDSKFESSRASHGDVM